MLKTPLTGVDSSTTFVLDFDELHAQVRLFLPEFVIPDMHPGYLELQHHDPLPESRIDDSLQKGEHPHRSTHL